MHRQALYIVNIFLITILSTIYPIEGGSNLFIKRTGISLVTAQNGADSHYESFVQNICNVINNYKFDILFLGCPGLSDKTIEGKEKEGHLIHFTQQFLKSISMKIEGYCSQFIWLHVSMSGKERLIGQGIEAVDSAGKKVLQKCLYNLTFAPAYQVPRKYSYESMNIYSENIDLYQQLFDDHIKNLEQKHRFYKKMF